MFQSVSHKPLAKMEMLLGYPSAFYMIIISFGNSLCKQGLIMAQISKFSPQNHMCDEIVP
jgi:hypothetical protein